MIEKELSALRKLWLALTLLGLLVSLNVLSATQGGAVSLSIKAAFGIDFAKDVPEAVAALWGVIFLTVFVGFASAVLAAHAVLSAGGWTDRYAFRIFELPMNRGIGRAAQVLAVIVLTLGPGYVLGHSWQVMLDHGVLCSEVAKADWRDSGRGASAFFGGSEASKPRSTRMTSSEKVGPAPADKPAGDDYCMKEGQTSYGAPWQSWLMAVFSALAFFALGRSLWFVGRNRGSSPRA